MKFLHIADLHLGAFRYGSIERSRDFFYSFKSISQVAIDLKIDFVLISGDLFDKKTLEPRTYNQAVHILSLFKEKNIPVFIIEGNHDSKRFDDGTSWLATLSSQGYCYLLQSFHNKTTGALVLKEWNNEEKEGSYFDYNGIRIIGLSWYGLTTRNIIKPLKEKLKTLPEVRYTILMMHYGIQEEIRKEIDGIPYQGLSVLKEDVDYLAMGHFHKSFIIDDWAYNPGSLEALNVEEAKQKRGAFVVEIPEAFSKHNVYFFEEYERRPFYFIGPVDITMAKSVEEIEEIILNSLRKEKKWDKTIKPIVEVKISGKILLDKVDLNINSIIDKMKQILNPFILIPKFEVERLNFEILSESKKSFDKKAIEEEIFKNLVSQELLYKDKKEKYAELIHQIKKMVLDENQKDEVIDLIMKVNDYDY